MSFFSKLYQALGFGSDIDYDTEEVSSEAEGAVTMEQDAVEQPAVVLKDDGVSADMHNAIFNHVLDVFNSALPDFLARSVNPEVQRKLLFESLDQGLKDYLSQLAVDADQRCQQRWSSEQTQLRSEMDNLKRKSEQVESERSELKERQLSAERQKRALSNRLKDLEMQVEKLDAEREQYDLENKSLMNKLKVMAVQNPEAAENLQDADTIIANVEDLQRKLEEVSKENESLRTQLQ
ncbi:MAG: hypothetical protein K2M12_08070, partial [Muribaculaceae bacterium]|nr:hypothetical protein [Muribaculaceae bacterium]